MNMEMLIDEIEITVRSNLRNFDNMYQAVNIIFHRDLKGKDPKYQNGYIRALMSRFSSKKYWFFSVPSKRRIQLMGALAIARKFNHNQPSLYKLISAGDAVLKMDIGTFKVCFKIGVATEEAGGPERYY